MSWDFLLYIGLALWCLAHLFKRLAPEHRAAMEKRMGKAARGSVALVIIASVVLMVIGYREAAAGHLYDTPDWGRPVNNLLMILAGVLFGLGSSKSRARSWIRHPMLTGVLLWAIAHMLVNGDSASIALFGILGLWAIAEMLVINHAEPNHDRFREGTLGGDIRLIAISAVVFTVIAAIHIWISPNPFGG